VCAYTGTCITVIDKVLLRKEVRQEGTFTLWKDYVYGMTMSINLTLYMTLSINFTLHMTTVNREILVMALFWPILAPKYEVPKLNTPNYVTLCTKSCQTISSNVQVKIRLGPKLTSWTLFSLICVCIYRYMYNGN
jgi:hypothetical protein